MYCPPIAEPSGPSRLAGPYVSGKSEQGSDTQFPAHGMSDDYGPQLRMRSCPRTVGGRGAALERDGTEKCLYGSMVSIVSGLRARGFLSIQRSANSLTASTAAVATLLYYTRRDPGVVGNLIPSRFPVMSITARVHLSHFPLFSFSLSWVGSVNVWGWGLAFTRRCDHTVIFYLIKNRRVFQKLLAGPGPSGAQLEIRG